jgi:ketosteroid isomerase-like protein
MSEENVEIVRQAARAWESGDLDRVRELTSDDLVTYRDQPDGATRHGMEGFLEMTLDWIEGFDEWSGTTEEVIDAGDRVLARFHQSARGEASGVPVEEDWWFVYAVEDGKIARVEMYRSRDEALEAAGLSE